MNRTPDPVMDYDMASVPPRPAVGAGAYDTVTRAARPSLETIESDAPAHWGPALINGDWTGMTDSEARQARHWAARLGGGRRAHIVDMGPEWFGTYRPFAGGPIGCDMATFTALVEV